MKKLPIVDAPDDLKILLDSNSDAMKSTRTAVMRALASVDEGLKGQAYAVRLLYLLPFSLPSSHIHLCTSCGKC
jgi:hypothetical protein